MLDAREPPRLTEAEKVLTDLAAAFPLINGVKSPEDLGRGAGLAEVVKAVTLPEVDARYRTLVEQIPVARMFGYLSSELKGKSVEMLIPGGMILTHLQIRKHRAGELQTISLGAGLELREEGRTVASFQ